VTSYNPSLFQQGAQAALIDGRTASGERSLAGPVARQVQGTSNQEILPFIGHAPQLVELKGELERVGLSDASVTVSNLDYAIGLEWKRSAIRDDQFGAIAQRMKDAVAAAFNYHNKLIITQLESSVVSTSYDGVSLFNDAHPARGKQTATQDNLLTGTGVTTAAFKTDLNAAIAAMLAFKDEGNEPVNAGASKFTVLVPPALIQPANEAIYAKMISSTDNVGNQGFSFDVIVASRLADANDWFLVNNSSGARPVTFVEREAVQSQFLGPESEYAAAKHACLFKVWGAFGTGAGLWYSAVKTVNS
jgi:phage major head subunit gpT-like protein